MRKLIPIVVILLGVALYAYFGRIRPALEYDPVVRGSGTIEATEVLVSAKIPARIVELRVAEGDRVSAGELLARLACDEPEARLAQAQAQLEQARAVEAQAQVAERQVRAQVAPVKVQHGHAAKERDRAVSLFKSAGATERTVDQAETAYLSTGEQLRAVELGVDVAHRGIRVAQAQVAVAEKNLALAQTQVDECTLEAPQGGVVLTKHREVGELVLPGAALVKLGNLDEVHTWIYVPNEEVGRVRIGQKVALVADTYPDRVFAGQVSRIKEEAEFTPKSIQTKDDRTRLVFGVKVAVSNPDRALLPGMPIEAEIEGSDTTPAAPPSSAPQGAAPSAEPALPQPAPVPAAVPAPEPASPSSPAAPAPGN
jgi:HlyD family secretion protein